jgi:hypothetical protein
MYRFAVIAALLVWGVSPAPAWAESSLPLPQLARLLVESGHGDVRSLVADGGRFQLLVRKSDGAVVRAVVDNDGRAVEETGAAGAFIRYAPLPAHQMSFADLLTMIETKWPGCALAEIKRFQGAFEVHLRAADGIPVGALVNAATRTFGPYHSLD